MHHWTWPFKKEIKRLFFYNKNKRKINKFYLKIPKQKQRRFCGPLQAVKYGLDAFLGQLELATC